YREAALPGAILTRIASSHIRVGTFQYHTSREDPDALRLLAQHVIARHYPEAADAENPILALIEAVINAQAGLVAHWMALGFIHGVMNTDNMSIAGETIDYGPCAFMDIYHPETVFSSIDHGRRYAYGNQPLAAHWNLAQFASSLLPILDDNREAAIEQAQGVVNGFSDAFQTAWLEAFRRKLGLTQALEDDAALINDLLDRMAAVEADYTQTFRALAEGTFNTTQDPLKSWYDSWTQRLSKEGTTPKDRRAEMRQANPAIIPRNHLVEDAIQRANSGDYAAFHALTEALQSPFDAPTDSPLRAGPTPENMVHQTFCGT
ncbi:MAG: protein adenylyltransferase SelO family protein, partial [Pseudomonadota bacterium]